MSPDPSPQTATLIPETAPPEESVATSPEVMMLEPERLEPERLEPEQLVSTYADTLMTGLFGDLDRLLDGDEAALNAVEAELKAPPAPEETALQPLPPQDLSPSQESPPASDPSLDTALATFAEAADYPTPAAKTTLGKWFDRLLLGCTALSLAGVAALLWLGQRPNAAVDLAEEGAAAQSDTEFLTYLQRSLDTIEQQVAQNQADTPQEAPTPWPNNALLPPVGLPPQGLDAAIPGRINVIERVYIPYQTTPPAMPTTPPAAPPVLERSPIANPPATTPTPSEVPPATGVPSPAQPATPGVSHVLVGVLELGSRSAALFDINGISQRVYIGERIGNAGWSLVSVSNQEAVVRRNGEVRSIYIGQQF
ncbi:MAG: hypothetical protein VKI82_12680 [Leptolyngbya sp.]|nr:hypothetical protein [Leptolyngbya sp.]